MRAHTAFRFDHRLGGSLEFLSAQDLAMRAVAADFGTGEEYFEAEVKLDLTAQFLQGLAEEFLDLAAPEADDVRVLLLHPRFVVVLVAADVHQVKFVDEAAGFEHLEGAVDGDAIELGVLLFGHEVQPLGVEVLSGFVDEVEQDLPLPGKADASLPQRIFDTFDRHFLDRLYHGAPRGEE